MAIEVSEEQKSFDRFFSDIVKTTDLFNVNPHNIDEQKAHFFAEKANPVFVYSDVNQDLIKFYNILKSLKVTDVDGPKIITNLLAQKHKELIKKFELATSIGSKSFTKTSISLYGKPSKNLIKKAEAILQQKHNDSPKKKIPKEEAILQLRRAFKEMDIKGWRIRKASLVNNASVVPSQRLFKIKKRERLQQHYINRLKIHEVGVHVARFENGCLQNLHLFRMGFPNYLSTEEGLAMYAEEITGLSSAKIMRNYAGRVLAVHYALENDFLNTYKKLLKYFDKKEAFGLTLRAKRGLRDTSEPGAFTKDYLYLKGYFEVKKFAEKNSLSDLYYGKIGLEHISLVKEMQGLVSPKYIPSFARHNGEEAIEYTLLG